MKNIDKWVIGSRLALLISLTACFGQNALAQCVTPTTPINFSTTGANASTDYITTHVATNAAGVILSEVTSGFGAPGTDGDYNIYCINYNNTSGNTPPTLTPGINIAAIGGTCTAVGTPVTFCVTTLPVKLASFSANNESNSLKLEWTTTEQVNTERFDIQRSADAKQWAVIGSKAAAGESYDLIKYDFTDPSPMPGLNYYRLKMIDRDATFAYSGIRSIRYEGVSQTLTVYPNPISDVLYLKEDNGNLIDPTSIRQIEFVNTGGVTAFRSNTITSSGVSVHDLINGIYTLKITLKSGAISTKKVVVMK